MAVVQTIETKHIFIDIVNYTYNRSVEAQTDLISYLNTFVKESLEKNQIDSKDRICIPTGDGMCISLLNISIPYDIHIKISLDILKKINSHNDSQKNEMRKFQIRIGINENIDNLIIDINDNKNISGSGINYAARIESLADGNQILVGNSVFEKLVQREQYMKSFDSYSAEVKHGLPLKVHHFKNDKLEFLNNDIPSKFKPAQKSVFRLSEIQAYYLANCLVNEDFISKNIGSGQNSYSMQTLLLQLSEDCYAKTKTTKLKPDSRVKVKRPLQEHFDYIQEIDFWIICDLNSYIVNEYLSSMYRFFSDPYLFVNQSGKKQLLNDHPKIYEEFNIK
ncbi:adenylate/guanylate cyclase domain-containing protein [uncultured Psychroserpens sp.]|uniref:adenylate/guanylate cyclase domain-containing protein n=1 Tax=uncultured Psychroserpens sp. TaxID=255436 RepID=UPI00260BF587|nr:adenylate/guanylate cyclase domain-containing protein [uncultured Psychroserpens sp.]